MEKYTSNNVQSFIAAWTKYLQQEEIKGKRLYLISVLYKPIRGADANIRRRIFIGIEEVYAKLLTNMFPNPWDPKIAEHRPIFLCCLDWPVIKKSRVQNFKHWDTRVNNGGHLHAIGIMPRRSELGCGLEKHFQQDGAEYLGRSSPLIHIYAERIRDRLPFVTDYALKGLKRERCLDDWLILPASKGEGDGRFHSKSTAQLASA